MKLVLFVILFVALGATSSAFQREKDSVGVENEFQKFLDSVSGNGIAKFSFAPNKELYETYNDYAVFTLKHRERTFQWQYVSGIIVFWFVIFIVASGIVLSIVQFTFSYARLKNVQDAEIKEMELKISPTELSIRSSVLGVIILVISIVFFYLYLTIVYPISVVQ